MTEQRQHLSGPLSQWPLCAVITGCLVGLALLLGDWLSFRPGATVVGLSIVGAAVLRAALSTQDAGLLAVRTRTADVVMLAALGIAIVVLAWLVPLQP